MDKAQLRLRMGSRCGHEWGPLALRTSPVTLRIWGQGGGTNSGLNVRTGESRDFLRAVMLLRREERPLDVLNSSCGLGLVLGLRLVIPWELTLCCSTEPKLSACT